MNTHRIYSLLFDLLKSHHCISNTVCRNWFSIRFEGHIESLNNRFLNWINTDGDHLAVSGN